MVEGYKNTHTAKRKCQKCDGLKFVVVGVFFFGNKRKRRDRPNENEKKINDKRQIAFNVALIEAMSA